MFGAILEVASPAVADCSALPSPVQTYLKLNPQWSLVEMRNLEEDDQKLWQKLRSDQCPGMAVVDLDGSGKLSYALALLRHEHGIAFEKLVIVMAGKSHKLEAAYKIGNPAVVWRGLPGVYVEFYSRHKTRISHDTVIYEHLEATASAYYLSHGKFRSILTSD